jgi:hypothetical protein
VKITCCDRDVQTIEDKPEEESKESITQETQKRDPEQEFFRLVSIIQL